MCVYVVPILTVSIAMWQGSKAIPDRNPEIVLSKTISEKVSEWQPIVLFWFTKIQWKAVGHVFGFINNVIATLSESTANYKTDFSPSLSKI